MQSKQLYNVYVDKVVVQTLKLTFGGLKNPHVGSNGSRHVHD